MEFMKGIPDKYYELAIIDPPYGIGVNGSVGGNNLSKVSKYKNKGWDKQPPSKKYFKELIRISQNQIIWGGNYFLYALNETPCFIVWNKENSGNFADCELAWTSFKTATRMFSFRWNGMLQGNMKNKETRIHETQKPVALYKWLLKNYAKPNDKIFDSHVGSGSIRIACHDMGFDFEGCEIDKDYWEAQEKRYKTHVSQQDLFTPEVMQDTIYQKELL
jgi:site-specific DNA-methyltransferase (adenine-specific)